MVRPTRTGHPAGFVPPLLVPRTVCSLMGLWTMRVRERCAPWGLTLLSWDHLSPLTKARSQFRGRESWRGYSVPGRILPPAATAFILLAVERRFAPNSGESGGNDQNR